MLSLVDAIWAAPHAKFFHFTQNMLALPALPSDCVLWTLVQTRPFLERMCARKAITLLRTLTLSCPFGFAGYHGAEQCRSRIQGS